VDNNVRSGEMYRFQVSLKRGPCDALALNTSASFGLGGRKSFLSEANRRACLQSNLKSDLALEHIYICSLPVFLLPEVHSP